MIIAWQKSQRQPETGYLTAPQIAMLRQQASPAIARYDEEQKKADEERRRLEEDARLAEEARRKTAEQRTGDTKPPQQQAAVAPPVTAGATVYVGELTNKEATYWKLTVRQDGSRLQFVLHAKHPELTLSMNCQPAELRPDGRFFTSCRQLGFSPRTLDGTLQSVRLSGEGRGGGGVFTLVRQ